MTLLPGRRFCDVAPVTIPAEDGLFVIVSRDTRAPDAHVTLEIRGDGSSKRVELRDSAVGILVDQLRRP